MRALQWTSQVVFARGTHHVSFHFIWDDVSVPHYGGRNRKLVFGNYVNAIMTFLELFPGQIALAKEARHGLFFTMQG